MNSRDESSNVHALKHKINNKRGYELLLTLNRLNYFVTSSLQQIVHKIQGYYCDSEKGEPHLAEIILKRCCVVRRKPIRHIN